MRAPACMITSAFVAQLATCVGYERCWLFIPRRCRIRIAAYIFSRAEMQTCALKDSTAYVTTSCGCRPKVHKWLAGLHAEDPQGHAGPHRLADKMSPSQPSSVGTEATCPVVVAHILARWRMPMVRPVCPAPGWSLWLASDPRCGGVRGRAELDGRRTSLSTRKCVASGLVHC